MSYLGDNTTFKLLNEDLRHHIKDFDCGNDDLNEFFREDSIKYSEQLLGKTYCFHLDNDESKMVALFTVSNDSIKTQHLPNSRAKSVKKKIPREKQSSSFPSVLIGRLGLHKEFHGVVNNEKSIGDEVMDFIKAWFVDPSNKTGCRFIVVDAYNQEKVINYYSRNGFKMLFSSEEQEGEYFEREEVRTRLMMFDLITLNPTE